MSSIPCPLLSSWLHYARNQALPHGLQERGTLRDAAETELAFTPPMELAHPPEMCPARRAWATRHSFSEFFRSDVSLRGLQRYTAVSFALTTAPAGAVLSGNTITWTPTPAQSQIANKFKTSGWQYALFPFRKVQHCTDVHDPAHHATGG